MGFDIDLDAAHRVVHGRHLPAGVPGSFGHLGVGRVVGLEAELVFLRAVDDGVVGVDGRLELRGIHARRLGKLLERVGCDDVLLGQHVLDGGAVAVGRGRRRIAQDVHDDPVRRFGLGEDGLAERVARRAFAHEPVSILVDEDAIAP